MQLCELEDVVQDAASRLVKKDLHDRAPAGKAAHKLLLRAKAQVARGEGVGEGANANHGGGAPRGWARRGAVVMAVF